jgi:hypothetical protein
MSMYEVTVPVVVTVHDGKVTGVTIDNGFSGLWTEAEDPTAEVAWNHVRKLLEQDS